MALDTLSAAKSLTRAGFSETGAEAIVTLLKQSSELPPIDHLATRKDVETAIDNAVLSLKLFVASSVLGGAAMIVPAQIVLKALGIAS